MVFVVKEANVPVCRACYRRFWGRYQVSNKSERMSAAGVIINEVGRSIRGNAELEALIAEAQGWLEKGLAFKAVVCARRAEFNLAKAELLRHFGPQARSASLERIEGSVQSIRENAKVAQRILAQEEDLV